MKEHLKKSNKFAIVINAPLENQTLETLQEYQNKLKEISYFTASIIHNQDFNNDNTPKINHLHLFLEYQEKYTCKQVLTQIIDILECQKNQISVSITNSEILYIQYLTHLNDQEKTQYLYSNIITNNAPLLEQRYENQYQKPQTETEFVLDAMEQSISIKELSLKIGIDKASRYRALFNQYREERGIFKDDIIHTLSMLSKEMQKIAEIIKELEKLYISNIPYLTPGVDKTLLTTITQINSLVQDIATRTEPYA